MAGAADLAAVVRSAADGVVVVIGRVGDCRRWIAPALGRLHRRWPEAVPSIVIVTAAGLIGAAIAATHPL